MYCPRMIWFDASSVYVIVYSWTFYTKMNYFLEKVNKNKKINLATV